MVTRTHAALTLAIATLVGLTALPCHAQLMPPTQPPAAEELANFESALQSWLTSELALQDVQVAATQSNVSVGFELASDDREEIVSQILLVALQAGPAARWAQNLRISPAVAGYPTSVITVPVDAVRRLANGQLDEEGFLRTWQTDLMPVMAADPAGLTASLSSNTGWTVAQTTNTDGLSALVEFGLPEAHDRLPENHPASLATVQTIGGEVKVGVIDVGDATMAEALLGAIANRLGATVPSAGDTLSVAGPPAVKIVQDHGLLYIASGPDTEAQTAINTLADPSIDPTLIADASGTGTGGQQTGNQQTGNQQTGNQQTGNQQTGNQQTGNQQTGNQQTGNQQTGNQQTGGQVLVADNFDGALTNWDTSMVAVSQANGALAYTAQQGQSLILRQPLPMDDVVIEFRAMANTNGLQVYLMKTQNEHYGWLLGMGGNQHAMLVHDASGQALQTVMGAAYTPGQWHTWRLVHDGNMLQAYRDGQLLISSDAATAYTGQGLLVFSTDNATVTLDDLRVYPVGAGGGTQVAGDGGQTTGDGGQTAAGGQATGDGGQTADTGPTPNPYEAVPLAEDSVVKQAIVCLGFDDRSNLVGCQDVFPSGTEKVALYMEIEDASPNSEIQMSWQKDGKIIGRQLLLVSGDKKNLAYLYAGSRETLWDGHYAVDIKENGNFVGRVIFTVGTP